MHIIRKFNFTPPIKKRTKLDETIWYATGRRRSLYVYTKLTFRNQIFEEIK